MKSIYENETISFALLSNQHSAAIAASVRTHVVRRRVSQVWLLVGAGA